VLADVEAVEGDEAFAVGAVEFKTDTLAGVGGGQVEDTAIPADTSGCIGSAEGVKAFAGERGVIGKGQLNSPVMGQVDGSPVTVVEGGVGRGKEVAGFLEVARAAAAEAEVFGRVVGIAEVETPAEVEEETFA